MGQVAPEELQDAYGTGGWTDVGTTDKALNPSGTGTTPNKSCKIVVYYHANGASGTPPETSIASYYGAHSVEVHLSVKIRDKGNLEKSGYSFLGWSTKANVNLVSYRPGDVINHSWARNGSGNDIHNLYAVWSDSNLFIYKPGEDADQPDEERYYRYIDKPLNQEVALADALFTRNGYIQVGWQTEDGQQEYDLNESYTSITNASLILCPIWAPLVCELTFDPNGGVGEQDTVNVSYGADVTMFPATKYSKDGYHIVLWNEKADGSGSSWAPGQAYTFTRNSNITLYAIWAGDEYIIRYYDPDADNSTEVELPSIYDPRTGAEEIESDTGRMSQDLNGVLSFSADGDTVGELPLSITQNGVYIPPSGYAYNSIHVNVQYGTPVEIDPTTVLNIPDYSIAVYGSPFYTDSRPAPKEGYKFAGWKTTSGEFLVKQDAWMDAYSFGSDPVFSRRQDYVLVPVWIPTYPFGKFFYNGKESSDYGIVVEQPPSYSWPEKAYVHYKVKGRNGDILLDPKKYENVKKTYKIAVYDSNGFYSAATKISSFLHKYSGTEYIRLEDTYEPDVYMMGIYEESYDLENILGQAGRGEISFSCKPQKFLITGNRKVTIASSGEIINNPTNHPASPIINIMGTGTVRVNGVELEILKNFNSITIDCETYNAVSDTGLNMNQYISLYDPITLDPGENVIEYDESIIKVVVTPRWWKI